MQTGMHKHRDLLAHLGRKQQLRNSSIFLRDIDILSGHTTDVLFRGTSAIQPAPQLRRTLRLREKDQTCLMSQLLLALGMEWFGIQAQ